MTRDWVAWDLNPDSPFMTGACTLIAFSDPSFGSLLLLLPFLLDPFVKLQRSPSSPPPSTFPSSPPPPSSATPSPSATAPPSNSSQTAPTSTASENRGLYVQGYSPIIHPTTHSDLSSHVTIDLLSSSATAIRTTIPYRVFTGDDWNCSAMVRACELS